MGDVLGGLFAKIGESILKGAVTKAVNGFVAKGEITAAQAPVLVEGVMLEVQVALEIYDRSQSSPATPP